MNVGVQSSFGDIDTDKTFFFHNFTYKMKPMVALTSSFQRPYAYYSKWSEATVKE